MRFLGLLRAAASGTALIGVMSCGGDTVASPSDSLALVMFVNVSFATTQLRVSAHGYTDDGQFGRFCLNVDPARPDVSIVNAATGIPVTGFTPSFAPGRKYTVFIRQNLTGTFSFITVQDTFTPSAGKLGLRLYNGANVPLNVWAVGTTPVSKADNLPNLNDVAPGTVSGYVEIPDGPNFFDITFVGTTTSVYGWGGGYLFPSRANITLMVTPTAGTAGVEGCTLASNRPA